MASTTEPTSEGGTSFRVGDWLVEPRLNRIVRGDEVVQLELKSMDVLLCLAERAGEVVSRYEIQDAVWQTEFVADNTLVKRIAQLREALGDDARDPRYIETIPKRGYRLVAPVGDEAAAVAGPEPAQPTAEQEDDDGAPYPGLAPFTEADAADFFGREAEIVTLWRKITSRRLLAVVGASGAGKSSLLRAGVVARPPPGWRAVVCQPGQDPFLAVALALAPDAMDDADEMRRLLAFSDPDVALAAAARWRGRWDEALLVVDQFEELFTLNSDPVRERFVALLRRLVDAAGIHVVLVLRDDFLLACHRHSELAPIFGDLVPIGPPTGVELRRAVMEPAVRRLVAFESELLVDEMVGEVESERGALPLVAFAMSRLWELRDRERRLLTREAYEAIGGVGGALAQHAEATLEAIGPERAPFVRELFRNLVTGHGTRAVRDEAELISVFPAADRDRARSVLAELVDARLLTAYQGEAVEGAVGQGQRRVEIVHESLLTAWPRLLRWQTRDADAAQLRDQLRQSAQVWDGRGRPDDLLWTGTPYQEFDIWRRSYPGGLSAVEEAFAEAMTSFAGRTRRRRRLGAAALVAALAVVAGVVTTLWQRSERDARRVEARRLHQLGREAIDRVPPEAVAYAIASLELADDPDARRLALDALARSPMPMVLDPSISANLPVGGQFSPDGRWLVVGQMDGHLLLVDASGRLVASWRAAERACRGYFTPDSRTVATVCVGERSATAWSVPEGSPLGTIGQVGRASVTEVPAFDAANFDRSLRWVRAPGRPGGWAFDPTPLQHLGPADLARAPRLAADSTGTGVVVARGREIRLLEAPDEPEAAGLLIGRSGSDVVHLALDPGGRWVASHGEAGEIEIWSLDEPGPVPLRAWRGPDRTACNDLRFDRAGTVLAGSYDDGTARLWRVDAPPGADPIALRPPCTRMVETGFHPGGGAVVTTGLSVVAVWPHQPDRLPLVLSGHSGEVEPLAFAPDGRFLLSGATDGTVRYWPLDPTAGQEPRVLFDWGHPLEAVVGSVAVSRDGRFAVATGREPSVRVISIEDGTVREVGDFDQAVFRAAIGPSGTAVAMAGYRSGRFVLRIFELETGAVTEIDVPQPDDLTDTIGTIQYLDDGRLLTSPGATISEWRPGEEWLRSIVPDAAKFVATPDGRVAIARPRPDRHPPYVASVHDLERGTSTVLTSHGSQVHSVAIDPSGTIAVTGSFDGVVRVGRVSGEEPHHLVSGGGWVSGVAVSSDGRWIAAGSKDGTIRLWPMPDLSQPPLHSLSHRDFLARLGSLTNLRVVPDPDHPGDSVVEPAEPFPGWKGLLNP